MRYIDQPNRLIWQDSEDFPFFSIWSCYEVVGEKAKNCKIIDVTPLPHLLCTTYQIIPDNWPSSSKPFLIVEKWRGVSR